MQSDFSDLAYIKSYFKHGVLIEK